MTTAKVHAVLQRALSDSRGGTFGQRTRVLVSTLGFQENPHRSLQILHAAMYQDLRGASILLRVFSTTEDQEAQDLLVEIQQQQPGVVVLRSPASAVTNVGTASEFLADAWSTESVGRVVRAARTKQENNGKERAEHALRTYIQDESTTFDTFPAAEQGLDEGEHPTEKLEPEDDQDDETEHSLSDSLQGRRQIATIHENMGHPSNRTLVRALRLGGAKRRFVLAAANHFYGACEAQKRPAGPIVSRSPNSFVFNVVVGLDLFFLNTYEKHTLPATNIVCWDWIAACCSLSRPVGRNFEVRAQKQLVAIIRKAPHPCHRSATQLVLWHFCRKSRKRRNTT